MFKRLEPFLPQESIKALLVDRRSHASAAGRIGWYKASAQVDGIARLSTKPEPEIGFRPVCPKLIRSANRLIAFLRSEWWAAPTRLYPMPDGTVTLEWQLPGDVILRIEVDDVDCGEAMISYPDKEAEFTPVDWIRVRPTVRSGAARTAGCVTKCVRVIAVGGLFFESVAAADFLDAAKTVTEVWVPTKPSVQKTIFGSAIGSKCPNDDESDGGRYSLAW